MVRRAARGDAEELARMRAALVGDDGPWTDRLIDYFYANAGTAFVIDRPGGLAACAAATIIRSLPGPDHDGVYANIHTVYTDPDCRHRGYARAVVRALVSDLARQGCGLITLNATDDGRHLYESLGFTTNERSMRLVRPTRAPLSHLGALSAASG